MQKIAALADGIKTYAEAENTTVGETISSNSAAN